MAFCPTCRSEFRPEFTRCEECDAALVESLPEPPVHPPVPNPAFQSVYRSTEISEALTVTSLLEGQGISARIDNEHSAMLVFGLSTSANPYVVSVPSPDAADAAAILKEAEESRPRSRRSDRLMRRLWMIAIVLMVPVDWHLMFGLEALGRYVPPAALGILSLALILDIRTRVKDPAFSELRILSFFASGATLSIAGAWVLQDLLLPVLGRETWSARHQFLIVGPVEECTKFLPVLALAIVRPAWFRDPIAWVVACASTGAGFAVTETFFKMGALPLSPTDAFLRFASGFLHPFLGGMTGFFISKAGSGGVPVTLGGLAFAAFLHGGWNTLAFQELEWICFIALAFTGWFYLRNVGRLFPEENAYAPSSSSAPAT
jgi:RsiW-degrading membrane proteinase PrsW (M82 family)